MNNKTIWIINQYAGSPYHGMEYRHYYLAKEMVKLGVEVFIISGSYSHLYQHQPVSHGNYTFEIIDGINYCWIKVPPYKKSVSIGRFKNMGVFMWKLFSLPSNRFQKPDAIIVSSPSLFPILNGVKLKKKFNAKLIFEIRDIWPLTLLALGKISSSHPAIKFLSWFEKYGYRHSDKIVSLLPNCYEHLKKFEVNENKFTCIPNGIDEMPAMVPTGLNLRDQFTENFIVGYAGTLGISNAMEFFLESARNLFHEKNNSIVFVLVGDGGEVENLKRMATGLTNVFFYPRVPKTEIPSILNQFDACYIGWHNNGLYRYGISANKIFDYMLSSKPVVHSINSFNDPIAESGCGISVPAEDTIAISEAIKKMSLMNETERSIMGARGKAFVLKNHSYSNLAKKYLELIDELG